MGGYNACIYLGLMAGSIGLGPVIESVGFGKGFWLTGALTLPFVTVYAWSMRGYTGGAGGGRRRTAGARK
jgi:hypothetical protein